MTTEKKDGPKAPSILDFVRLVICAGILYGLYSVVTSSSEAPRTSSSDGIASQPSNPSTNKSSREYAPSFTYAERDIRGMVINIQYKTRQQPRDIVAITLLLSSAGRNGLEAYSGATEEVDISRAKLMKATIHANDVINTKWICNSDGTDDIFNDTDCIYIGYDRIKDAFTATTEQEFR